MAEVSRDIFIDEYLKRLQYTGPVKPNLQTLQELHKHHLLTIPFENLNNIYQQHYASTKHDLFHKIIKGHRGGLCFELNSLFAFLLQDLGYDVTVCSACVYADDGQRVTAPMGGHQLSVVTLEGQQWMVDVGFGRLFVVPLLVTEDVLQDGLNAYYKLKKELNDGEELIVLYCSGIAQTRATVFDFDPLGDQNDNWRCQYKFTTCPRSHSYFDSHTKFILEDPKSPFNKGLLCTILRPWGRLTLSGRKLIKVHIEDKKLVKKDVTILNTREDVITTMDQEFGIKFNEQYSDMLEVVLGIKHKSNK